MIAIQHTDCSFRIIHKNVVEDKEHSRTYQRVVGHEIKNGRLIPVTEPTTRKAYKCKCCGKLWLESITSPVTIYETDYNKRPNDKSCKL